MSKPYSHYWNTVTKEKLTEVPKKKIKKREQELSLTLDRYSPRPQSTREEIYLDFNRKTRGGQR